MIKVGLKLAMSDWVSRSKDFRVGFQKLLTCQIFVNKAFTSMKKSSLRQTNDKFLLDDEILECDWLIVSIERLFSLFYSVRARLAIIHTKNPPRKNSKSESLLRHYYVIQNEFNDRYFIVCCQLYLWRIDI